MSMSWGARLRGLLRYVPVYIWRQELAASAYAASRRWLLLLRGDAMESAP